jgi:phospholipid/cholesterol/gamma-HCH transport system substrate-binding protein
MRRTNDFVVGLVTLAGAAVIVGATLWVQQTDLGQRESGVTARFRDVGNVQVGNAVVIRGVRAGRVKRIELADGGWVEMQMLLDPAVELPHDPAVLVSASSLFGEWQATVMSKSGLPPNPDVQQQIAEASGDRHVLPGASLPDIAQLTGVAARIADDVASVAERVQVAFTDSAARELRRSIGNVERVTSDLAVAVGRHSNNLDGVLVDVRAGTRSLNAAAASLRRTTARIDSSTSAGEITRMVADAGEATAQLRAAAVVLRAVADSLSASQGTLQRVLVRTDSVMVKVNAGQGSLGQLVTNPSLYHNGDSLVAELRDLVADIRAHPKKYVNVRIF